MSRLLVGLSISPPSASVDQSGSTVLAKLPLSFTPMPRHAAPTVWVMAEIGVNHDSRLDRAIELVDAAVEAGADAIKLQLFDPRYLLSNQALLAKYQQEQADSAFTMLDKFK